MEERIQIIKKLLLPYTKIDYAFLFGSYLSHPMVDSDVDILLGASLDSSEKLDLAMQLELILKRKVDIVLAAEASSELLLNALSKGLPIIINDKLSLKKDYLKSVQLFDDNTTLRNLRKQRIKKKFRYA